MTILSQEEFELVGRLIDAIDRLAHKRMPSRMDGLLERLVVALEGGPLKERVWNSTSNSPSELRRKHMQGTCDRRVCPYVSRVGEHLSPHMCLNCTMRPRLSREANFCEQCAEVEKYKDVVLKLESEREGWQEERDRAVTERDNAQGTIAIVRRVVHEAREESWKVSSPGHVVALLDGTLENIAELVGVRLQSRPPSTCTRCRRPFVPKPFTATECGMCRSGADVAILCQHPHGTGICGKKEPCAEHAPKNIVEAVADLADAVQAERGKPMHEILFPHVAYRHDAPPVGEVPVVLKTRTCARCKLEERSVQPSGKVARIVRVETDTTCADGEHAWTLWEEPRAMRAPTKEEETAEAMERASAAARAAGGCGECGFQGIVGDPLNDHAPGCSQRAKKDEAKP